MPDLLTHFVTAYGTRELEARRRLSYWFLIGAVLPDVLTRPWTIVMPSSYWFTMPFHTPIGLLLVSLSISLLVAGRVRSGVFFNLLVGSYLHVVLDILQAHIAGGYYLFFPFSWRSFEVGIMWPEDSLYLLPLWIVLGIFFLIRRVYVERHQGTKLPPNHQEGPRTSEEY